MSKLQRLRDNIAAIEEALRGGNDMEVLGKYSGFGGLGFVLNGDDPLMWTRNDMVFYADTLRLRSVLMSYCKDDDEYQAWMESLKSSVLTAFYTPREIPEAIFKCIFGNRQEFYAKGNLPKTMLDPAAGMGVFGKMCKYVDMAYTGNVSVTYFEKDILTATMLKAMEGGRKSFVYCDGFENFPKDELGTYDLVSTNVPFGAIGVYDRDYTKSGSAVKREAAKMIHRYFMLKGMDALRDGGIEAMIITSNYLNRDYEQVSYLLQQSRLIGAYRLANNLFAENGTTVGTDLIVLQKDVRKQGITADESMLLTMYEEQECPTNLYFRCYPDHVVATDETVDTDAYGKPGFVYSHKDGVKGIATDLGSVLAKDMREKCDVELFERGARVQTTPPPPNSGGEKDTDGSKEKGRKEKKQKADRRERLMKVIHQCYTMLYGYEAEKQAENTVWRKRLNRLYDVFAEIYGMLNGSENRKIAKRLKIQEVLALEVRDGDGRWQKADIMLRPIAFSTDDIHEAANAREALAQSLNDYGRPDMQYMAAMTGKTEEELLEELDGEVYWDPIGEQYEIKAKFVCGNVIEKIEQIKRKYPKIESVGDNANVQTTPTEDCSIKTQSPNLGGEAAAKVDWRILKALRALEDAVPTPIPFEELDFNLGERWVDAKVYARFASEFFSMPDDGTWRSGKVEVRVSYQPLIDQYAVERDGWNEKVGTQYCVTSEASSTVDGMDLLTHALQNTCPKMMRYRRDKSGCRMRNPSGDYLKEEDPEKTQLANTKVEEIRQAYVEWLQRQPKAFKDGLADVYNRRFNCFVKPTYDGSHQTFPGIDMEGLKEKYGIGRLYDSQKDCIWMLKLNGGGICDHEVGSGKTLIMCVAAHEMKRLGLCHKPMIIGLKANVSAIAETYRTAYPQAKILFATEADYSAGNRVDFFNRMKNNDWDCVIMSHDQFGRIPQSDGMQEELLREELRNLTEALRALSGWGTITSKMRKGLELRKRNLQAKIERLQEEIAERKDDVADFQMMGIDHIFVDESHQFKNLGFSTRHDRVAGIGNTEGSKRSFNLLTAIRTIQRRTGRDLGATFLSGTTVTNSLTELYSLFRYLRPKALRKQNISCFDAWAAIFTKKSQEWEFGITNNIQLKERFRYFIKVPELAMFYNEITDFRTAEDVGIERPRKHAMLLNIQPTPDQEEFIRRLMEFARTGDFKLIGIDCPTDKQQKAKMLYATDLARKMSLDMRMIDKGYGDHPRSKASKCAQLVKRYYDQYDAVKGTQLVFSDLSTWQNSTDWSVYSEIKRKLVDDYGIPAQEVRFIQECKSDRAKQRMIQDVNEGKVRVLFGSTSMLGTGVNAQKRVVAVHHLDTPWRPSDLEQRDGRAIRRGNEIAEQYAGNQVDVIIYAVERSLDSYKFNLLHCKQTFINQLKRGQLSVRTLDEGAMDENTGMNFAEYMAVLSGNRDLLERAKLEKRIACLEAERKNFYRDQRETEQKQAALKEENERMGRWIADAGKDYEQFMKVRRPDENGFVENDLRIDGFTPDEGLSAEERIKALGERLLQIDRTAHTDGAHIPVGTIYGFRVMVRTAKTVLNEFGQPEYENVFSVEGGGCVRHTHNDGYLNHVSPRKSAENPLQALTDIPDRIEQWEQRVDINRASIEQLGSILTGDWPKEDELKKLRNDLGILDRKINEDLKKTENSQDGYKQAA